MLNDRSTVHEFLNLSKLLAFPGDLTESASIDFSFKNVEKPYETYVGINAKLRYTNASDVHSFASHSLSVTLHADISFV